MKTPLAISLCLALAACGRGGANVIPEYLPTSASANLVQLCGNPDLLGEELGNINGQGACGIPNAVSIEYVSGVRLSQPATLNCRTANTLAEWVDGDAQASVRKLRSRITGMTVFASYACRSRNNQSGARLSEHALGNAIDIGAFTLANGEILDVESDWGKGKNGAALARLHETACGPFGTVLGPLADRFHYNHFHLDTASYRSGAYCK